MTQTQTALAKRPVDLLKQELARPAMQNWLQKQLAASLNRNADQMINILLNAAAAQPKLAECTPSSLLAGLVVFGQIGLVPHTALGHGWLVPFKNKRYDPKLRRKVDVMEATPIIGYQGFVKLVYDACRVGVKAASVYSGEPFEYNRAAAPPVTLHKHAAPGQRGKLVYAYCLGHYESGLSVGEVYDEEFVHERRARSRSYGYRGDDGQFVVKQDSPWVTDPAAMWLKTAVRAFTKLLPKGNDARLERAIEVDALDDAQLGRSSVVEMVELPGEAAGALEEGDAAVIEQAQRGELGPGEDEEFQRWAAHLRDCTELKQIAEVELKIGRAKLPPAVQERLAEVAKDLRAQLRGAGGK